MRKTGWAAIAVLASAIVAAGSGGVFAGEADQGPGQPVEPGEMRKLVAKRVAAPSYARAAASPQAAKKPRKTRPPELIYKETKPQTLVPGPTGFRIGNCPKRANAINGYYYVAGKHAGFGLDNQGDSPIQGLDQWAFYLDSAAGASGVTFGLVCLTNVNVR